MSFRTIFARFQGGEKPETKEIDVVEPVTMNPKPARAKRRHFPDVYPDHMLVPPLDVENPFKEGSQRHEDYETLLTCTTIGDALSNGLKYGFIDRVIGDE